MISLIKKILFHMVVLTLAIGLWAMPTQAERDPGAYVQGGVMGGMDLGFGDNSRLLDLGPGGYVGAGYNFGLLGIRGSFSYLQMDSKMPTSLGLFDSELFSGSLDLKINPLANTDSIFQPYVVLGAGPAYMERNFNGAQNGDWGLSGNTGIGFDLFITDHLAATVETNLRPTLFRQSSPPTGISSSYDQFFYSFMGGITYHFGGGGEKSLAPSPKDTDGDGLLDEDEVSKYGTDPNNPDTDGDGLMDGQEVKNHKTDPKDKDSDNDGLIDGQEVKKYTTNPLNPDTDSDSCQDGKEVKTYKTNPKKKDCPPAKIELKGKINFKTNSAEILPSAYEILDDAVKKMKNHPEIDLVEIEGHTDARGNDAYNLSLSERRANSVRQYFISKGISSNRLKAKGYGETQPIADNATKAGQAENRRIVFSVIRWK